MIKLTKVTIHKFKSFESDQTFEVGDDITVLVGMNESGKTSILHAIAKCRYFDESPEFKFNLTTDYPRKELANIKSSNQDPPLVTLTYEITDKFAKVLPSDILWEDIKNTVFSITHFEKRATWTAHGIDTSSIFRRILKKAGVSEFSYSKISKREGFDEECERLKIDPATKTILSSVLSFANNWEDPIREFFYIKIVRPSIPVFLYYDEYYQLPSEMVLEKISDEPSEEHLKTGKALLNLAGLKPDQIIDSNDYELFNANLEATEAEITQQLFKFWKSNSNLRVQFKIDKKISNAGTYASITEHILYIRVVNTKLYVSLPLHNRSKGFNWFFSFLVWFKSIQNDNKRNYILLLDEPGLNLHGSAQYDLLSFIEDLSNSKGYQIIYTTHSPFMVKTGELHKVRTVFDTEKNGSVIKDSTQEKDPRTLFPLQAALGYDIAQNLFINKKNLVVEGISDLTYIQFMSELLNNNGGEGLKNSISIVPAGGSDKVASFVSLLRGQDLDIVVFMDTFKDQKSRDRLANLEEQEIIKSKNIIFTHSFSINKSAPSDIEDLFDQRDYLRLFNSTYPDKQFKTADANKPIMPQLEAHMKSHSVKNFNHYTPAKHLLKNPLDIEDFCPETIKAFTELFRTINKLL